MNLTFSITDSTGKKLPNQATTINVNLLQIPPGAYSMQLKYSQFIKFQANPKSDINGSINAT